LCQAKSQGAGKGLAEQDEGRLAQSITQGISQAVIVLWAFGRELQYAAGYIELR
jgi:hypothetical protein